MPLVTEAMLDGRLRVMLLLGPADTAPVTALDDPLSGAVRRLDDSRRAFLKLP